MNIVNVSEKLASSREELWKGIESFKEILSSELAEGFIIGETQLLLEGKSIIYFFDIQKETVSPGVRKIRTLIGEHGQVKIADCFVSKTNSEEISYHPVEGFYLENSILNPILSEMKKWYPAKNFKEQIFPLCNEWVAQQN